MTDNLPALSDEYCLKEFGWTKSQFETVQRLYLKNLSVDEIKVFSHVCKVTGLDPFQRQIYAIVRGGKMTIQTAIDGFRLIADRTGRYSPGRETTFVYDKEGKPFSATAYIKKRTNDGTWHEVAATAYFKEYNPGVGTFWAKMPHTMISKCAEALALRKAFPAELSGVLTSDEMDQAGPEDNPEKLPQSHCEDITQKPEQKREDLPQKEYISPTQAHYLMSLNYQLLDDQKAIIQKALVESAKANTFPEITVDWYDKIEIALKRFIASNEQAAKEAKVENNQS